MNTLAAKIFGVLLGEAMPLLWQIVRGIDGGDWADWNASATIDALDGINVELFYIFMFAGVVLLGMDAIHRTGVDTGRVLCSNTGFRDYISHKTVLRLGLGALELPAIVTACDGALVGDFTDVNFPLVVPIAVTILYLPRPAD